MFACINSVLCLFLAQDPEAVSQEEREAIRSVFDRIGQATDKAKALGARLSGSRLLEEMEAAVGDLQMNAFERALVVTSLVREFSKGDYVQIFGSGDIRSIQRLAEDEVVVHARPTDEEGQQGALSWWLVREREEWRIYDWEDRDLALRASVLMGSAMLQAKLGSEAPVWAQEIAGLESLLAGLDFEDPERLAEAEENVAKLNLDSAPKSVAVIKPVLLGSIYLALLDIDRALAQVDLARVILPGLPIVDYQMAYIAAAQGDFETALKSSARYLALFPDELDMIEVQAEALQNVGRLEQALAAYRRGLAFDPSRVELVVGLALLLPPELKSEIGDLIASMKEPTEWFEVIGQSLLDAYDLDALGVAVATFEKIDADHLDTAYYTAQWHYELDRPAEALLALEPAWERLAKLDDPLEVLAYHQLAWSAHIELGQAVAAYEAARDRDTAFDWLAEGLASLQSWDSLEELLQKREALQPESGPTVWSGVLLRGRGKPKEAAEFLTGHRAVFEPWIDVFERHVIQAWIEAREYEKALTEAKRSTSRDEDPYYELVVHVHAGDSARAIEVMSRLAELGYVAEYLYFDPDLAEPLQSDAMAPFREHFPPGD